MEKRRSALKKHAWRVAMERARRLPPAEKAALAAAIEREEERRGTLMTAEELAARLGAFGVAGVDCERVMALTKEIARAGGAPVVVPKAPPHVTIRK